MDVFKLTLYPPSISKTLTHTIYIHSILNTKTFKYTHITFSISQYNKDKKEEEKIYIIIYTFEI